MTEVFTLVALTRQFRQFQRAELRLNNQIKAIERMLSGDQTKDDPQLALVAGNELEDGCDPTQLDRLCEAVALVPPKTRKLTADDLAAWGAKPLLDARDYLGVHRKAMARQIEKLAEQLPVWPAFVADVRGCGRLGLGLIVGEAGNLSDYPNPAKLWKRMGLAVGADGRAQRRVKGTTEELTSEAIRQGYSPRRRSLMHVVGEALVKLNQDGRYRRVYDERKTYEIDRAPDIRPIVAHRRAMRVMEKRFLVDLWKAWRRETSPAMTSSSSLSPGTAA